jgi:hypothetical protein
VGKTLICPSVSKIGSKVDEEASEMLRGEIQITISKVQFYRIGSNLILPDPTDEQRTNAPNANGDHIENVTNADEEQLLTPNDDGEILIKVPVILSEGLKFLLI